MANTLPSVIVGRSACLPVCLFGLIFLEEKEEEEEEGEGEGSLDRHLLANYSRQ